MKYKEFMKLLVILLVMFLFYTCNLNKSSIKPENETEQITNSEDNLTREEIISKLMSLNSRHEPLKIWTAGDSITFRLESYRNEIWEIMQESNFKIDFVGTNNRGDISANQYSNEDDEHDGYGGYNIEEWRLIFEDVNNENEKLEIMQQKDPDLLLIMLGTNNFAYSSDLVNNINPVETSVDQMLNLINLIFEWFDDITIIVGTIPPARENSTFSTGISRFEYIETYNEILKHTVESHSLYNSKLFISDNYSVLNSSDFPEGDLLHPSADGQDKIALEWCNQIVKYLELE